MDSESPAQGGSLSDQPSPVAEAMDWAAWLREYGPRLFLFARQQLYADEDAEDVMQEALVQLVRAVEEGSFRGGSDQYAPYVYSAIRNRARDHRRRELALRRKHRRYREQGRPVVASPEPWLESALDDAYLRNNVENLLRTLPGVYAEVVVLHIWGEYTFFQIAEMVGCTPSTASSRFRYAVQVLRRKLSQSPDPDFQP